MSFNHGLNIGDVLDNGQLKSIFKCSTQGGMRRSLRTNTLIIISNHVKSVYNDRWLGDVFHYTGMGLNGEQSLEYAQNKTLAQSNKNGVEVYLFEVLNPRRYTFKGQVYLATSPYQENQPDVDDTIRKVWVFPLMLAKNNVPLTNE
jgi:5-methylcytosine-specific restriction protein A